MIVISNTTPLHYLVLIDAIDILSSLFIEVWTPTAVVAELKADAAPAKVRDWIESPPNWLHTLQPNLQLELGLGAGEQQAISLAEQLHATLLLVDDRRARQVAEERGLAVTGTLGVLTRASTKGLIDLNISLNKPQSTTFRASKILIDQLLAANNSAQNE